MMLADVYWIITRLLLCFYDKFRISKELSAITMWPHRVLTPKTTLLHVKRTPKTLPTFYLWNAELFSRIGIKDPDY